MKEKMKMRVVEVIDSKEANEIVFLSPSMIVPNVKTKGQEDRNKKDIDVLAEDILERTQMVPIIVTPYIKYGSTVVLGEKALQDKKHKYWIIDGNRRYFACLKAGKKEIKCTVMVKLSLLQMYEVYFATNAKRLDVNPYDMAVAIEEYLDEYKLKFGEDKELEGEKRLASVFGYSIAHIRNRRAILDAPKFMQEMIQKDETRANIPIEIENAMKNPRDKKKAYKALKEKKVISTLDFRPIGKRIKKIDKAVERKGMSTEKRNKMVDSVIETFRLPDDKKHTEGNLGAYLASIEIFEEEMRCWNLDKFTLDECSQLSGALQSTLDLLRDMIKQSKKVKRLPKNYPNRIPEERKKDKKGKKKGKSVLG